MLLADRFVSSVSAAIYALNFRKPPIRHLLIKSQSLDSKQFNPVPIDCLLNGFKPNLLDPIKLRLSSKNFHKGIHALNKVQDTAAHMYRTRRKLLRSSECKLNVNFIVWRLSKSILFVLVGKPINRSMVRVGKIVLLENFPREILFSSISRNTFLRIPF